jgi:hypothetical protein
MMKLKKGWIIIIAIILLFICLNPSLKDFDEYQGGNTYIRKEYNFIIFSVYRSSINYNKNEKLYIGILKNFIFIKRTPGR